MEPLQKSYRLQSTLTVTASAERACEQEIRGGGTFPFSDRPDNLEVFDIQLNHGRSWMFFAAFGARTPHVVLLGMVRCEGTVAEGVPGFHWE